MRRAQDSNLQGLAPAGFRNRCITILPTLQCFCGHKLLNFLVLKILKNVSTCYPSSTIFLLKNYVCAFTNRPQIKQFICFPRLVTLMIPDPKPFVNFFHDLANIISHFEKPLIYKGLQQEVLQSSSP